MQQLPQCFIRFEMRGICWWIWAWYIIVCFQCLKSMISVCSLQWKQISGKISATLIYAHKKAMEKGQWTLLVYCQCLHLSTLSLSAQQIDWWSSIYFSLSPSRLGVESSNNSVHILEIVFSSLIYSPVIIITRKKNCAVFTNSYKLCHIWKISDRMWLVKMVSLVEWRTFTSANKNMYNNNEFVTILIGLIYLGNHF